MSACCSPPATPAADPAFRRVLWIALVLNASMFVVELLAAWRADSLSLLADSIDFIGDAGNYALSLAVLGLAASARSRAALFKAACMGAFGLFVLARLLGALVGDSTPHAATMGLVGFAAFTVNLGVAWMLYRHRHGDANRRSVWLCSRNDALGNLAVMLAAFGVFSSGSAWPDWLVAAIIATLALTSAWTVAKQAKGELLAPPATS